MLVVSITGRYSDILADVLSAPAPTCSGDQMRFGEIIYVDDALRAVKVGSPVPPVELQAADIVFGSFELLNPNLAHLDVALDLSSTAEG